MAGLGIQYRNIYNVYKVLNAHNAVIGIELRNLNQDMTNVFTRDRNSCTPAPHSS